ncbi:GFA family protein [Chthonobacter rhizosphaerae]|uniref:GFA family protein n=1 Tax=Chthonobacter rhizosphaerae TaxID=2735553 RepID=UPI0015EF300D|nr:GFA family protein [Chthonobacter rhizosphaerae]
MATIVPVLHGGCLCGAVRYSVRCDEPVVDYCHCAMCRKASGGVVSAWIQVPPADFTLTHGTVADHVSSERGTRHFCPRCGAQLYMTDPDGRSVGVTVGTLDDPEAIRPTVHGWDSSRPSWLHITDDLPRYDEAPPYDL